MANYLTRIELHGGTYSDYEKLHTAMQRAGFSRTIGGDDGKRYQLPTAEYVVENSSSTLAQVQQAAKDAAGTTGKSAGIISVLWSSALWSGLTTV